MANPMLRKSHVIVTNTFDYDPDIPQTRLLAVVLTRPAVLGSRSLLALLFVFFKAQAPRHSVTVTRPSFWGGR